jgi:Amt family ammonium transporter
MNQADTAWMLISTALVLLMTPALAFFYGGLVRAKNALNTMMMSFAALGAVGLAWALAGYSLAFGPGSMLVGDGSYLLLRNVTLDAKGAIPHLLFMCYQGTFAIVTAALVSGAIVERMRFGAYLAFLVLWSLLVYSPIAHWVWGGGILASWGALDFAGGTVVHVNAAVAALVCAMVVGPRKDFARQAFLPHNVPFTLLGADSCGSAGLGSTRDRTRSEPVSRARVRDDDAGAGGDVVVWTLLDMLRARSRPSAPQPGSWSAWSRSRRPRDTSAR